MKQLTSVNTDDAVAQERQGTTATGLGHTDAASDAFYTYTHHTHTQSSPIISLTCPPIDIPVSPTGPSPSLSNQFPSTILSSTKVDPITNRSDK